MDAIAVISFCFPKKTTVSTKEQKITKFSTALLCGRLARVAHSALRRYSGSGVFSVFHNPVSSILYTTYGTLSIAPYLDKIDVFATSDHKFLLNAARGMGYCYISKSLQDRIVPTNAGWKAGAVPFESFYGPNMQISQTASRFDNPISWLAAIGDEAALSLFGMFGVDAVYARNIDLVRALRDRFAEIGQRPIELPAANQSTIVDIPLVDADPALLLNHLQKVGVICSARDGNLRVAVHFYNNFDDIDRLVVALKDW